MSLWSRLKEKLDFSSCAFKKLDNIIVTELTSSREGTYYIIKNSEKVRYLKLTEKDYFIWTKLDGNTTVKDIVVAYFMKYGSFAFERVGTLITELKENYFLETQPVKIFRQIKARLIKHSFEYYIQNFRTMFFQKEIAISGIDGYLSILYKYFVFLFYTKIAKILYILLSITGFIFFLHIFHKGNYQVFKTAGSYSAGFLTLFIINSISIAIHEAAHAFTTKSYGRSVPRGGFLIYYGSPSYFAETTDIWLEPKARRITVSWAGPFSNIILASICSWIIFFFPGFILNNILYKIACLNYGGAFFNLNPLLELDGYFILMDWLEIPLLRKRAVEFLKSAFWKKIFKREKFSEEERIFTIFGLMATVWTNFAIFMSVYFLTLRSKRLFHDLIYGTDLFSRFISAMVLLIFVVPAVLSIFALIYIVSRKIIKTLVNLKIWNDLKNIAILLLVLSGIIFIIPFITSIGVYKIILPLILLVAFYRGLLASGHQKGSCFGGMLSFSLFILMLFFASLSDLLKYKVITTYFEMASSVFLAIFMCQIFRGFNIRLFSFFEKILFIFYIPAMVFVIWHCSLIKADFPVYFFCIIGITAQFLFIPSLFNYFKTNFFMPFILSNAGILALTISVLFELGFLKLLASLLILSGLILYTLVHKRFFFKWEPFLEKNIFSEKDLLFFSMSYFIENILMDFSQKYGNSIEKNLEMKLNDYSQKENINLFLENKKLTIKQDKDFSVIDMADSIIKVLDFIIEHIIKVSGEAYIEKLLFYGRDNLYWKEREILDYYVFEKIRVRKKTLSFRPNVPGDKAGLIKNIPFFTCIEDLDKLINLFRMETFLPGQDIIRQGEEGKKFYIITEGEANVFIRDISGENREVATLKRGDFFGEVALFEDSLRTATVRASVKTEVLAIDKKDFKEKVKDRFGEYQELHEENKEIVRFIEKISLFDEFPKSQINFISWKMRLLNCREGEEIISQGETGRRYFYVIRKGEFLVEVVGEDGEKKTLSRLGPGEYFGEIALLLDIPRTATVRAVTDGELYTLEEKDFDNILGSSLYTQKTLELVSSRKLYNK